MENKRGFRAATHVLDHRLDLGEEVAEFHVRREQQASVKIWFVNYNNNNHLGAVSKKITSKVSKLSNK